MVNDKLSDLISIREICTLLEICQQLLSRTHPSASLMIEYAVRDLKTIASKHDSPRKPLIESSILIKDEN
jgi:hypothetical protein